jgi:hypothetical protein
VTPTRTLRAVLVGACALGLSACGFGYGASFDYPDEPPTPGGTTVVAKATGSDDDDPMRGREVVIDLGNTRPDDLVEFYREQFPSSDGWSEGQAQSQFGGGHLLCLVRNSDDDFDEYVEIYPYDGRAKSEGRRRYRVSISRLSVGSDDERSVDRCGVADDWFPSNL